MADIKVGWDFAEVKGLNIKTFFGKDRADFLIINNNFFKPWSWKSSKTLVKNHKSGYSKACIDYMYANGRGCKHIILSAGYGDPSMTTRGQLHFNESLREKFPDATIYYLHSSQCVDKYNELIKRGEKVGMFFHTTC